MTSIDDWELARRAAQGDMHSFSALVRRYQKPVIQFCYQMTGSMPDAEDIGQETFINLYRSLGRLRAESSFSTLVFCYARNATLNHLRSAGRRQRRIASFKQEQESFTGSSGQPDRQAQAREVGRSLRDGINGLPPEYREVLVLREFQGLDYQRIAEIVGCPVGTVRSRLARAREHLREHLLQVYGDQFL